MANASIRLGSKTRYDIEVNDQGECISFDMNDPELMFKFDRCITAMKNISDKFKAMKFDQYPDELETDELLTAKQKVESKALADFYKDMRAAMDEFLGKGACQKIFGDNNWFDMFDDLIEALTPHFKAMGLNYEKTKKEIVDKYSQEDSDVI